MLCTREVFESSSPWLLFSPVFVQTPYKLKAHLLSHDKRSDYVPLVERSHINVLIVYFGVSRSGYGCFASISVYSSLCLHSSLFFIYVT
jgi:hypothetical protein